MFIGHHAAGLIAKRLAPRLSLGVLFAAAMWIDLIWPLLALSGLEHFRIDPGNTAVTPLDFTYYPISHSLLAVLGWSVLAAIAAVVLLRASRREALITAAAVLSHWVLDFVTHRPDLPLWPGGPKAGLGLWQSVTATVIVESGLFAAALALYVRATRPRDRTGSLALWGLVALVSLIYVANFTSPPPPHWKAVAWTALAAWLFVPWGWWIDRHREQRT